MHKHTWTWSWLVLVCESECCACVCRLAGKAGEGLLVNASALYLLLASFSLMWNKDIAQQRYNTNSTIYHLVHMCIWRCVGVKLVLQLETLTKGALQKKQRKHQKSKILKNRKIKRSFLFVAYGRYWNIFECHKFRMNEHFRVRLIIMRVVEETER